MNAPIRLNDLVRNVDREPRIPDLTLADRLGFAKPHNVRKLIDRNRDELASHGAIVVREASFLRDGENPEARKRGGRPGVMYFLNEGQALVVCALSRTPIAAKVRQDIIAVYMAHRKHEYCPAPTRREREALHFLATNSCVIETGEPVYFDSAHGYVGLHRRVLLAHITDSVLDTLAEFENDEVILTEDELDQDAGEMPELDCDSFEGDTLDEHGEEDRADAEPVLGWCNNVGQLRLDVGGSYGDGDSTAPERAGAGFQRCSEDDAEPSLGWPGATTGSGVNLGSAGDDREHDLDSDEGDGGVGYCVDDEPMLGAPDGIVDQEAAWSHTHEGGSLDAEETALETHGAGFIPSGGDDAEDGHDAEAVNEDGCELGGSDNGLGDEDSANEQGVFCGPPMFPEAWSSDWTGGLWKQPEGAHPKSVVMRVVGTCMLPRIRDGAPIVAEPVQPKAGEIAILFIEGVPKPQVKLLVADIPPAHRPDAWVEFHMLNPPTRFCIPRHRLRGAWRFHSVIEESARL